MVRSPFVIPVLAIVLAAALISTTGCDSNDVEENDVQIASVVISPDSASIEVGEQVDFSVAALTAAGDTVRDAELEIRWWSTDPDVFDVEDDGLATGKAIGSAFCMVESARLGFTGRDSAFVQVLVF